MTAPTDAPPPTTERETDEGLVARLARGDEDALRALHHRYAALVFTVAARLLDAAAAEEVVQDVFVTLWKKHQTFDPARGAFKGWIVQITRRRALNELRRKQSLGPHGDESLAELPDDSPQADEARSIAHRRAVIRAAVDALPAAQRQALSLAYFDELTHRAESPRSCAPRSERPRRGSAWPSSGSARCCSWRSRRRQSSWSSGDASSGPPATRRRCGWSRRATSRRFASSQRPGHRRRLTATTRVRSGSSVGVLTTSHLPPLVAPEQYVAWARRDDGWHVLGPVVVEGDGRSLLVTDARDGVGDLLVTREASSQGENPRGPVVLTWSAPPMRR